MGGVTCRAGSGHRSWLGWQGAGGLGRLLCTPKDGTRGRQAVTRRGMRHSRGHIPLRKSGIICRGSGKMWAMTHILSRNMSWAWTASPLPAILGVASLHCMISTAQSSPRAWPAKICPYVCFFNEPGEKQIKPKVTLEGEICPEMGQAQRKQSRTHPCSLSLTQLRSPGILCCPGAQQQTALRTFSSLPKLLCFGMENCCPFPLIQHDEIFTDYHFGGIPSHTVPSI